MNKFQEVTLGFSDANRFRTSSKMEITKRFKLEKDNNPSAVNVVEA